MNSAKYPNCPYNIRNGTPGLAEDGRDQREQHQAHTHVHREVRMTVNLKKRHRSSATTPFLKPVATTDRGLLMEVNTRVDRVIGAVPPFKGTVEAAGANAPHHGQPRIRVLPDADGVADEHECEDGVGVLRRKPVVIQEHNYSDKSSDEHARPRLPLRLRPPPTRAEPHGGAEWACLPARRVGGLPRPLGARGDCRGESNSVPVRDRAVQRKRVYRVQA